MILWWVGNLLFLGAVLVAALLAHRVIVQALVIRRYADDIVVHGDGLAEALEPLPALEDTRRLVGAASVSAAAYAEALRPRFDRRGTS